jgi:hypothetical protein
LGGSWIEFDGAVAGLMEIMAGVGFAVELITFVSGASGKGFTGGGGGFVPGVVDAAAAAAAEAEAGTSFPAVVDGAAAGSAGFMAGRIVEGIVSAGFALLLLLLVGSPVCVEEEA